MVLEFLQKRALFLCKKALELGDCDFSWFSWVVVVHSGVGVSLSCLNPFIMGPCLVLFDKLELNVEALKGWTGKVRGVNR